MNAVILNPIRNTFFKGIIVFLVLAFTVGLAGPTLPAAQAKATNDGDAIFVPYGMISGTVLDATTALPLGGVKVEVNTGEYTFTDVSGAYSIGLDAGTYSVTASLAYYETQTITDVIVDVGMTDVDFNLVHSPVTLTGEVYDSYNNLPISGAKVEITGIATTYANTEGIYVLELQPGTYSIVVSASGYVTSDPIPVELIAEQVVIDVELERILPLPVVLFGTVTDAYFLTAIQSATVTLDTGQSTTTGPSGYFSFMLDAGVYTMTVSKSGYTSEIRGPLVLNTASYREDFSLYPVTCPTITINDVETQADDLEVSFISDVGPLLSVTYLWHFGDGETSTEANPTHTYADYGTYIVTLEVENVCGSTDTWAGNVTLKEVLRSFLPMAVK